MMKRLSSFALALALVTFMAGFACADESFRCGAPGNKRLVQLGDTDESVRTKCGEPQSSYSGRWVYNLGETDFIYSLFFRRGRLVSIDRGERGYPYPASSSTSSTQQQTSTTSSRPAVPIKSVDLIRVSATEQDGVIRIGLLYKNRDTDKLVYWNDGSAKCYCEIFENIGTLLDRKAGARIGLVKKEVKSFSQDFYCDVPRSLQGRDMWAIIDCQVNTGFHQLRATDDIKIH